MPTGEDVAPSAGRDDAPVSATRGDLPQDTSPGDDPAPVEGVDAERRSERSAGDHGLTIAHPRPDEGWDTAGKPAPTVDHEAERDLDMGADGDDGPDLHPLSGVRPAPVPALDRAERAAERGPESAASPACPSPAMAPVGGGYRAGFSSDGAPRSEPDLADALSGDAPRQSRADIVSSPRDGVPLDPEPVRSSAAPAPPPPAGPHLSPRRQHPSWIVLQLVRSVRGFLVPLIVVLVSGRGGGDSPFLTIAGVGAALGLLTTAARWWSFRYEVISGELRVYSGVVSKQERSVPLERVQAVDTGESPLQRLFGVVRVKVETAAGGAGGSDVTFESLTRAEAGRLTGLLRPVRERAGMTGEEAADAISDIRVGPAGTVVRALSTRELLVAGATSGRIGPALAIVGGGLQLVDDVLPDDVYERFSGVAMDLSPRGILIGGLAVGLLSWLFAIVTTVLTFGGFTLRRDGDNLLTTAGLLDRRQATIPLRRIQALTMTEGLLRQPFGLVALRVESAGYGTDAPETGILFPLLRRDQVEDLLRQVVPEMAVPLEGIERRLNRLPDRSRRRYALAPLWGFVTLTAFAVVAAAAVPFAAWWNGLFVLALIPGGIGLGLWRFADSGWSLDERGLLVVRGRGIARRTSVLPARRIQRRFLDQGPLQRRADLATFRAAVASGGSGGTVGIEHLDVHAGDALLAALRPRPIRPTVAHPPSSAVPGAGVPAPGTALTT